MDEKRHIQPGSTPVRKRTGSSQSQVYTDTEVNNCFSVNHISEMSELGKTVSNFVSQEMMSMNILGYRRAS